MRARKMETSKKILVGSWATALTLTAIVIVGTFAQVDVTNLTILAGAAWAELTAAHGFYYWKAKNENRSKGIEKLFKDMVENHGIDAVARLAELIFKE